jgi:hypothetical protein
MSKLFVFAIFVSFLSLPLLAQDKVEVFGGYQYLHTGNITIDGVSQPASSQSFNGWNASGTYYFTRYIGVQGDFGGSYATIGGVSTHIYTYTGGPVVAFRRGPINPYVHALFGGIDLGGSESGVSISKNGFTTMIGGGVDVKLGHNLSVRPIGVDWLYYHFGSNVVDGVGVPSFSQSNNVRITSGVVFRF